VLISLKVRDARQCFAYSAENNKGFLGRDWLQAFLHGISVNTLPKSTKGEAFDVNNQRSVTSCARLRFRPNSCANLLGLTSPKLCILALVFVLISNVLSRLATSKLTLKRCVMLFRPSYVFLILSDLFYILNWNKTFSVVTRWTNSCTHYTAGVSTWAFWPINYY